MTDLLLPDAGEAFRLWTISRTAVTDLIGERVSIKLTGEAPCIRYSLVSGLAAFEEHNPLMLVECWGQANALDDGAASELARTLVAEVPSFRGDWGDGYVAGAAVESGPTSSPDPKTDRPRQVLTVRFLLYPSPTIVAT